MLKMVFLLNGLTVTIAFIQGTSPGNKVCSKSPIIYSKLYKQYTIYIRFKRNHGIILTNVLTKLGKFSTVSYCLVLKYF